MPSLKTRQTKHIICHTLISDPLPKSSADVLSGRRTSRRENWSRILNRGYIKGRGLRSELSMLTIVSFPGLTMAPLCSQYLLPPLCHSVFDLGSLPSSWPFHPGDGPHQPFTSVLLLLPATQRSCVPIRRLTLNGSKREVLNPLALYSENYVYPHKRGQSWG